MTITKIAFLFAFTLFSNGLSAQSISSKDIAGKWLEERYTKAIWEFKNDNTLSVYGFGADQLWKYRIDTTMLKNMNITMQESGGLDRNKLTYSVTFANSDHIKLQLKTVWQYTPPGSREKIQFGTEWKQLPITNGPIVKLKRPTN